jgi:GWxTD domain-containing protein
MFLDYARFRYDDQHSYLEIYYMLYNLNKSQTTEQQVPLEFLLYDVEKDSLLAKNAINVTLAPWDSAGNGGVQGSVIKTVLPVGRYRIKMVRLKPDTKARIDSVVYEFKAPVFKSGDKIMLSDIELCSNIKTGAVRKSGLFYKNNMEVYPNPMRMYNKHTPRLYYYLEVYNLKSENPNAQVDVEIAIADTEGKIVANKKYKKKRKYESAVEVGSFDVSGLKNGLYTLIYALVDNEADYSVYNRTNFYMMTPGQQEEDFLALYPQSEFATMDEAEVDLMFDQAQYIANKNEIEIYKTLDSVDAKRLFLYRFWAEREKENPGLRLEYYRRVAYANEYFAFANREGWQSDRGRVYIKYGEPDYILREPSTREYRPYQIWFYDDIEGGVRFLFIDETGFGDYKMVSSTLRGEIYDANYDELLINTPR